MRAFTGRRCLGRSKDKTLSVSRTGHPMGLPAKAACQSTNFLQIYANQTVGASLLAMDVNDDACCLNPRGVLAFFASKLAPTGERVQLRSGRPVGRLAFALAFDLLAPSRGRVEVLRSGQPGMDAGLAAYGHGWPIAAGPRSRTGARECRALARHRTKGARALGYLGLFQVTRRQGGTVSGHYRRNGYSPNPTQSNPYIRLKLNWNPLTTCHQ